MTKLLVNGEEQDVDLQPDKLFVKINGEYYVKTINIEKQILTELEEYYEEQLEFIIELPAYTKDISQEHKVMELCYEDFLNKIQKLKEKYK